MKTILDRDNDKLEINVHAGLHQTHEMRPGQISPKARCEPELFEPFGKAPRA